MIKKINIALVTVFALMFGLKTVIDFAKERRNTVAPAKPIEVEGSQIPINVYYDDWAPFTCRDYLSGHLGCILDEIRVIFPKANFIEMDEEGESDPWTIKKLETDPLAVMVTSGDVDADFAAFPMAKTPTAYYEIRLLTLRSNPWRYTGPESLEKLRIATESSYLDNSLMLDLEKRGIVKVYPSERLLNLQIVKDGEADAVAQGFSTDRNALGEETMLYFDEECRVSDPIGKVELHLRTSKLSTEASNAIIHDYEEGMKRIEASGARRRAFEYYFNR